MSLEGKTLFITGASRGIGLAIALRAARDGANIAVAAKTSSPHKHLPGTIYSAAEEIEAAGGRALPLIVDVREEASVMEAVERTANVFGGIDICVNNASAIQLTPTEATDMKRYDLMHQVNARGTFLTSKACIPYLKRSANPHVLALSPPLDMSPHWFGRHVAYTMAKYGMSMCMLGMAEEFKDQGIAFNALWPRTGIATAAIKFALAGDEGMAHCRTPEIMADAAHAIFCKPAREFTGNFVIDDSFLHGEGVTDFEQYRVDPSKPLMPDFFVPADSVPPPGVRVRPATPADAPLIHGFVRDLADYEKLLHEVVATEDGIAADLFGPAPRVFCDIAEADGEPVGFALWFYNYSTFRGRHGIYLEDLYVRPEARGRGAGKALLAGLARRCVDEGLARLEWAVLDWNAPSIAFYDSLGAAALDDWIVRRLTGEALQTLAAS